MEEQFVGKWLELLQESVPRVKTVAVLGQIDNRLNVKVLEALEGAAPERGLSIRFFGLKAEDGISGAIQEARRHTQALLVLSDPITFQARRRLVALATKSQLPTVFPWREFVDDGKADVLWFGFRRNLGEGLRAMSIESCVARSQEISPIEQPTRFMLVVNLRTAHELRLQLPEAILLRADEVIRSK